MIDFSGIPFCVNDILFRDEKIFRINEQLWAENSDLNHLAEGLSAITGIPATALLNDIPHNIDEGGPAEDYIIKDGDEVSLLRIYQHIANILALYEPNDITGTFIFEYKGKNFFCRTAAFINSVSDAHGHTISSGEAIEVMELRKHYADTIEKMNDEGDDNLRDLGFEEEVGDKPKGSFLMSMDWKIGLMELAILCKQNGELLPFSKPMRDAWLADRMAFFEEIPLNIMIDLRFFLGSTLALSLNVGSIMDFGMGDLRLKSEAPMRFQNLRQSQT